MIVKNLMSLVSAHGLRNGELRIFNIAQIDLIPPPPKSVVIEQSLCGEAMLLSAGGYLIYQYLDNFRLHLAVFKDTRMSFCLNHLKAIEKRSFEGRYDEENFIEIPSLNELQR